MDDLFKATGSTIKIGDSRNLQPFLEVSSSMFRSMISDEERSGIADAVADLLNATRRFRYESGAVENEKAAQAILDAFSKLEELGVY